MKRFNFIAGFLAGSLIFASVSALANSGIMAVLSSQVFHWNNAKIELEAYNINGYNYVRLRDAAGLFGVDIEYNEADNSVLMGEVQKPLPTIVPEEKPDDVIVIDGSDYAKEDYSLKANQSIFDDTYTRAAYNAIRQTIIDREEILSGNDDSGYNENYRYAHFVDNEHTADAMGRTYTAMQSVTAKLGYDYIYSLGSEPNTKGRYNYPGYAICKVRENDYLEPARNGSREFIKSLSGKTDKDKVVAIADYISDRIYYDAAADSAGMNDIFVNNIPRGGVCADYSTAFMYLCQRANLPCITAADSEHAWNIVYADGTWQIVDVCNYDTARSDTWIYAKNYPRKETDTKKTQFLQELLVPNSTTTK